MRWQDHITVDPQVCHGQACIAGTRIPVTVVLDNLAHGLATEQLIAEYPSLTRDGVHAALAYASALTQERRIDLGLDTGAA